jgi:hypothetical protein
LTRPEYRRRAALTGGRMDNAYSSRQGAARRPAHDGVLRDTSVTLSPLSSETVEEGDMYIGLGTLLVIVILVLLLT